MAPLQTGKFGEVVRSSHQGITSSFPRVGYTHNTPSCMLLARCGSRSFLQRLSRNCIFPVSKSTSCHGVLLPTRTLARTDGVNFEHSRATSVAGVKPMASTAEAVELNRNDFRTELKLQALRVPSKTIQKYMKLLRGLTLDKPRLRCVVSDGKRTDTKLLLLREGLSKQDLLKQDESISAVIRADDLEQAEHTLCIDYSYWSTEHVLKRLLPHLQEVPAAFEAVGHIAHVNLPDELSPHRFVIGQVILDKNPQLKTVVNKIGSIENEYRVFQMECIAGQPQYVTEVAQHGNRFRLNFSEVYWNSRLEHEHQRLVDTFKPGETVVDLMAGIGPFVIPAARKRCQVYANDLNPKSFHYLQENIKLNKVGQRALPFCMDARHFMRGLAAGAESGESSHTQSDGRAPSQSTFPATSINFQHAILNLPASAVEFLDVFNGLYDEHSWTSKMPLIHCYTFSKGAESHAEVQQRVEGALGGSLDEKISVHHVRDVAPNKVMLCVSFRISRSLLVRGSSEHHDAGQSCKRQKCASDAD